MPPPSLPPPPPLTASQGWPPRPSFGPLAPPPPLPPPPWPPPLGLAWGCQGLGAFGVPLRRASARQRAAADKVEASGSAADAGRGGRMRACTRSACSREIAKVRCKHGRLEKRRGGAVDNLRVGRGQQPVLQDGGQRKVRALLGQDLVPRHEDEKQLMQRRARVLDLVEQLSRRQRTAEVVKLGVQ